MAEGNYILFYLFGIGKVIKQLNFILNSVDTKSTWRSDKNGHTV